MKYSVEGVGHTVGGMAPRRCPSGNIGCSRGSSGASCRWCGVAGLSEPEAAGNTTATIRILQGSQPKT